MAVLGFHKMTKNNINCKVRLDYLYCSLLKMYILIIAIWNAVFLAFKMNDDVRMRVTEHNVSNSYFACGSMMIFVKN